MNILDERYCTQCSSCEELFSTDILEQLQEEVQCDNCYHMNHSILGTEEILTTIIQHISELQNERCYDK